MISRQQLALVVAAAGIACRAVGTPAEAPPATARLTVGADVSALPRLEAAGTVYRANGMPVDALTALRSRGADVFRLRLFVQPSGEDVVVNDLAYTVALARRVRQTGARLLLDLHFSDTWADPGQQQVPSAWRALAFDSLAVRVERYTGAVLDTLRAAGVLPRIVQLGNEIDAGMLWPHGRIGAPVPDTAAAADRLARLLTAAARGVQRATTPADSVRTMLHISGSGGPSQVQWFFDLVVARGVPFDLIGLSYYPWWHGDLARLRASVTLAAARYQREVWVVETASPWRPDWQPPSAAPWSLAFSRSAEGQRDFVVALLAMMREVPNHRGGAVLWWYPEAVPQPAFGVWSGGALALFDSGGRLLPAADALRP